MNQDVLHPNLRREDFIYLINTLRKKQKYQWHYLVKLVEKCWVTLKFYGTWNQVLEIDGVRHGGLHGLNVRDWLKEINQALDYAVKEREAFYE